MGWESSDVLLNGFGDFFFQVDTICIGFLMPKGMVSIVLVESHHHFSVSILKSR